MKIIYHHKDFDGHASGAVLKRAYPDAQMVPYDYGEPFDIESVLHGEKVIMADVSFPMDKMMQLAERCQGNFVWIDHHKSAIDDFTLRSKGIVPKMTAFLQVGIAACELCWKWCFPDKEVPFAIKLLGMYDTWRQNEGNWEDEILPFQYGMRVENFTADNFPEWCFGNSDDDIIEAHILIGIGNKILAYQKNQNIYNAQYAFEARLNIEGTNFRAICINKAPHNSMSFDPVWDEEKYDVMVPFGFDGKSWAFSFYTTKENIDCSWIAKQFGGGGHKQAAGAKSDDLRKVLIIPERVHFN